MAVIQISDRNGNPVDISAIADPANPGALMPMHALVQRLTPAAPAKTTVTGAAQQIAGVNANRQKAIIFNDSSTLSVAIKFGAGASDTDKNFDLPPKGIFEGDVGTGAITAYRATGSADVFVTEFT